MGETLAAFEARCIRAGPLCSALLLARIALLFALRNALPARRSTPLGARLSLSTDCYRKAVAAVRFYGGVALARLQV